MPNHCHGYLTLNNSVYLKPLMFIKVFCFAAFSNWNKIDRMVSNPLSSCNP